MCSIGKFKVQNAFVVIVVHFIRLMTKKLFFYNIRCFNILIFDLRIVLIYDYIICPSLSVENWFCKPLGNLKDAI